MRRQHRQLRLSEERLAVAVPGLALGAPNAEENTAAELLAEQRSSKALNGKECFKSKTTLG